MKRAALVALVALLALVLLAGCGGGKLAGLWVNVEHSDFQIRLSADKTGVQYFGTETDLPFTWEVKDGELCITYEDDSGDCQAMTVDGDRMTLDGMYGLERYERWAGD